MPFKALRDGEPVISLAFSDRAWREEKEHQRAGGVAYACPARGAPVALATSPRGRPFFKHLPNSDCPNSRPKSAEHERLQVAVYRRCTDRGWTTDIETRGPGGDWTSDMLATRDDATYAFKVKLAPISGEALEERSAKYRPAGIVPVWLLKKYPARSPFPELSRTFVTAWTRRADPSLPKDLSPLAIAEEEIDRYFLDCETVRWSVDQTLIYWRELEAVLAEFDVDDPDHQRVLLRGRPTTLAELVAQTLNDDIHREFAASIGDSYGRYYKLVELEEMARMRHERLVREVRQELGAFAWERARQQVCTPGWGKKTRRGPRSASAGDGPR